MAKDIIIENSYFKLVIDEKCCARSLICKETGIECLDTDVSVPFFSLTEERPFNNEIKLAYMNKRTVFEANSVEQDGDILKVGFDLLLFTANVRVTVRDDHVSFELDSFNADIKDFPQPMDFPPVAEFRLASLPIKKSVDFGQWLNVCHKDNTSVSLISTCPEGFTDSTCFNETRVLHVDSRAGFKLKNCPAVLICRKTDSFLSTVENVENIYSLPKGVASRRDPLINASIYWVSNLDPDTVDEHIRYAKMGGYRLMLVYYTSLFKTSRQYDSCGNCDYRESYPEGEKTLKKLLEKIKAAGITPGFHFLHTHIGIASRYVTPKADHRLNLKRRFTLAKDIDECTDEIFVWENPIDSPLCDKTRILRFDTELIEYTGYTTEPPYKFYGCKRGHFETEVTCHLRGCGGGILDVSEFSGTSVYLDQNTDLQDEIGDKLAAAYDQGFEFIYFDGSEGTNAPFEYHIPNAQYRVYKKLNKKPIFCEGAAKAHFGWHILSGANAFDIFPTRIFKEMIIEHPFKEAAIMQKDFTRVNFGWWGFYADTRPDVYEFGTSKAASYDCPTAMQSNPVVFKQNPRTEDIFEVMRRWEDVRAKKWLTNEQKLMLRQADKEFTLLINAKGEYELAEYAECKVGKNENSLRAFVFERNGTAYATLWDDKGESKLMLDKNAVVSYTKEVETEPLEVICNGEKAELTVSGKAYIRSDLKKDEFISALQNAEVM